MIEWIRALARRIGTIMPAVTVLLMLLAGASVSLAPALAETIATLALGSMVVAVFVALAENFVRRPSLSPRPRA